LNQEVKIQGRFLSSLEDERIMEVRRISKFYKNYHSKDENDYDEYSLSDLISVPA
jgi:hypothetical protein